MSGIKFKRGEYLVKLCPFCGKSPVLSSNLVETAWWIICVNQRCGAEGPLRRTFKSAVQSWNKQNVITNKHSIVRAME